MRWFRVVPFLAAVLAVNAAAFTIDELDIGEQMRGPDLKVKDFAGKVVLVDLWGVNCVPCIMQLPSMEVLYSKWKDAGFHIVAMERQERDPTLVARFFATQPTFKSLNPPTFQFTHAYGIPIPGRYTWSLPQNFLFSADGQMVAGDLHGDQLESKIQELVVDALQGLTNPGDIVRLAKFDAKLKSGQNMMQTLSDLVRVKREAKDPQVVEEANKLFTAVFEWANKKFARAISDRETNPMGAYMRVRTLARELKGTEIGDKAQKLMDELVTDEHVMRELKGEKTLREVMSQIVDMKPTSTGSRDPDNVEFRRINSTALKSMGADLMQLMNIFQGTEAAAHAQFISEKFHVREN